MKSSTPTRAIAFRLLIFFSASTWLLSRSFPRFAMVWAALGFTLITIALVIPRWLAPLHQAMSSFEAGVRKAITVTLLILLYALVLTPVALGGRLFRKRFLPDGPNPQLTSYFIRRASGKKTEADYAKGY